MPRFSKDTTHLQRIFKPQGPERRIVDFYPRSVFMAHDLLGTSELGSAQVVTEEKTGNASQLLLDSICPAGKVWFVIGLTGAQQSGVSDEITIGMKLNADPVVLNLDLHNMLFRSPNYPITANWFVVGPGTQFYARSLSAIDLFCEFAAYELELGSYIFPWGGSSGAGT